MTIMEETKLSKNKADFKGAIIIDDPVKHASQGSVDLLRDILKADKSSNNVTLLSVEDRAKINNFLIRTA